MRHYDDYQSLYNEGDDRYYEYVSRELDKLKRRYHNGKNNSRK